MSTDLTITPPATPIPSDDEARSIFQLATTLAESGLFKDARQASQAFAKIMFGRDLGLGATQAMSGIDLIEGKPSLSANLQAALLRQYRSPEGERYDYAADVSADACTVVVSRIHPDGARVEIGRTTFSMADAQRAGLVKQNYNKYPANMLFARAMSNAVAFFAPEVTYGTRTYSEGELTGELVEPSPVAAAGPEPEQVDDRDVVRALRESMRQHGVTADALGPLLDAARIPQVEPLRKRIAMADDVALMGVVAEIEAAYQVQDAVVVDPDAEAFIAEQRALDASLAESVAEGGHE